MCRSVQPRSGRGAALVIALGVLALMVMLGGAFVVFMQTDQRSADVDLDLLRARYLARAGIEAARVQIAAGTAAAISGTLGEGTYEVSIDKIGDAFKVDATGRYTRTGGRTVSARIFATMRPVGDGIRVGVWQE